MDAIKRIENWFAGEHEGGDFFRGEREYPFEIIGPRAGCDRVIYCTKRSVALKAVHEATSGFNAGLVTRFGLPCEEDTVWLRQFIGKRRLIFVGDLDPPDVMIFAWLRQQFPPIEVVHYGINDSLIAALDVIIPESYRIQLNATEIAAVAELEELLPDIESVLGGTCFPLLKEGYKIELEAVVSAIGGASAKLLGAHDSW